MLRRRRVTQYDAAPPPRPLLWPWLVLLLALVIGGIAAAYFLTRDSSSSATKAQVPNVVGLSTAAAVQKLGQRGYPAVVQGTVSSSSRLGTVLTQAPPAGTDLARGQQVVITVARGPSTIEVPNVVGLADPEAFTRLQAVGLKGRAVQVQSTKAKGLVIQQAPSRGSEARKGSTVVLTVSKGAPLVTVPAVTGKQEGQAKATLTRLGFLSTISGSASTRPAGTVVSQLPAAGTKAQKGSVVALTVAGGPTSSGTTPGATTGGSQLTPPKTNMVVVPKVVGKGQVAATRVLQGKGLHVDSFPVSSTRPRGTVVSQKPVAGSRIPAGSGVFIYVSLGPGRPPTRAVPDVTGKTEQSARQTLILVGFTVRTIGRPATNPADNGIVLQQKPTAGKRVPAGSQILLYVGKIPSPTD